MFFGPQPLKQERSSISGTGQTNLNPYWHPAPGDLAASGTPVDAAKLNDAAAKKLEIKEAVKLAATTRATVRDGFQITDLLSHLRAQYNMATTLQAKQEIWNTTADVMRRGTDVGLLGRNQTTGKAQNAATFLGVGYDKIQVKTPTTVGTPPVKPEPTQTAETNTNIVTDTQTIAASNNTPAAVDPQVAVDVQTIGSIGSKMANVQDKKLQSERAGVAFTTAKPDKVNAAKEAYTNAQSELENAQRELGATLADLSSRYDDGLLGTNYKDQKKLGDLVKNNPALDKVIQDVATLYKEVSVSAVRNTHALAVLTGLAHEGKNDPAAKELAERLLAALQKPVAASQTSSSSNVPARESEPVTATALA
jgi:hypothetical protein